MKGRKPQPTALKIAKGNPGRRPLNRAEPSLPAAQREAPARLTERAREVWAELAPGLIDSGLLTVADMGLFEQFCTLKAEIEECRAQLARVSRDELSEHRYLLVHARGLQTLFTRVCAELGLTPTSRSRVHASPASAQTEREKIRERFFGKPKPA